MQHEQIILFKPSETSSFMEVKYIHVVKMLSNIEHDYMRKSSFDKTLAKAMYQN